MKDPLLFSAFVMDTASHILHGVWRREDGNQVNFNSLEFWIDLVRELEAGLFDVIFFADVHGVYGPIGGSYRKQLESGLQIPSNDPSVLLSALACNTEHLGLAITSSIVQEHPFNFARKMSTLDHASHGRIAWNIVTSSIENGVRNFGFDKLPAHDERYEWAREYMEVVYKLWEGSWDDGALLQNRVTGIHADVTKVHRINHGGRHYTVEGPHLVSPSPQRTPLLFQAGSSPAGMRFAAQHAEAQFLIAPSIAVAKKVIAATNALLPEFGRKPNDVKFFQGLSFVIGSTDEEVARLDRELDDAIDYEAMVTHLGGAMDISLEEYPMDYPIKDIKTDGAQSLLDWVRQGVTNREPVVSDVGKLTGHSSRVSGTPERIADELARWRDAGITGINVINATIPGSYSTFIEHVMPVLRERGLARSAYTPGTLRAKFFARDNLAQSHPGFRYHNAYVDT